MGRGDRLIIGLIVALALVTSVSYVLYFLRGNPFRPDYSVFWTAAQVALSDPSRLYDAEFITSAQSWLVDPTRGLRPWAYPPSALLALLPFAWLPFWASYLSWAAVTACAYLWAARRYVSGWGLLLVALSPPVIVAAVSGQTSLLVAAAAMYALTVEPKRPFVAGFVLGVAAAVKPQALIAAPLLLCRRGLAGMLAGGVGMVAASLAFGFSPWLAWLSALPAFTDIAKGLGLAFVTPTGLAIMLGMNSVGFWLVGAALGVGLAVVCRKGDASTRLLGLVGGGLLISPYAMIYDMVGLMPVAVAALLSMKRPADLIPALPLTGLASVLTIPLMAAAAIYRRRGEARFSNFSNFSRESVTDLTGA